MVIVDNHERNFTPANFFGDSFLLPTTSDKVGTLIPFITDDEICPLGRVSTGDEVFGPKLRISRSSGLKETRFLLPGS